MAKGRVMSLVCRRRRAAGPAWLMAFWLLAMAGRSYGEYPADWRVVGPLICRAEFPLTEVDDLLADLARLQDDIVRYLGVPPAEQTIQVVLFRDQGSYRRYLQQSLPEVPYRRALFVKRGGTAMVLAYRNSDLGTDLRHECTHALLHAVLPMVPLWLDEGLAEYFEVVPLERAFDNPHLAEVRWKARLGMVPELHKLENVGDVAAMKAKQYRDAWAWVHFMIHGSGEAHQELVSFLRDIHSRAPPGRMSTRLARRLPDLEQRFADHFKRWKR